MVKSTMSLGFQVSFWLFIIGAIFILSAAFKYLFIRKVENLPTSKAASAALGLVELYGKARCAQEMFSPIAKVKCAYWKIMASDARGGRGSRIGIYESSAPFYLEDESGKILVDPKDARIEIPMDMQYKGSIAGKGIMGFPLPGIDEKVLRFIEENKEDRISKALLQNQRIEILLKEFYIADGDLLYALGTVEFQEGISGPGVHPNLIVRKGRLDPVMYISDKSENEIIEKMRLEMEKHVKIGLTFWLIATVITLLSLKL